MSGSITHEHVSRKIRPAPTGLDRIRSVHVCHDPNQQHFPDCLQVARSESGGRVEGRTTSGLLPKNRWLLDTCEESEMSDTLEELPNEDEYSSEMAKISKVIDYASTVLGEEFENFIIIARKEWTLPDSRDRAYKMFRRGQGDPYVIRALLEMVGEEYIGNLLEWNYGHVPEHEEED